MRTSSGKTYRSSLVIVSILFAGFLLGAGNMGAALADQAAFASPAFQSVWNRTDKQVASGSLSRTFLWGPNPNTAGLQEDYAEASGGKRLVQYFDKSRMEITNPGGDKSSPFYVTNGLIARELMTGQLQIGDSKFETRPPSTLGVAGDADDTNGPTYKVLGTLTAAASNTTGAAIAKAVDRTGNLREAAGDFGHYNVTYSNFEPLTSHNIAKPFWDFLNQTSPILDRSGQVVMGRLFEPVYYATGLPLTEAYWAKVKVAGQVKDVLVQAFERRVLTYTPSNPEGYQVEMGNVGRHYYDWRYTTPAPPVITPTPQPKPTVKGCDDLPFSTVAVVLKCGPTGMQFLITALMQPGETVTFTPVDPKGVSQIKLNFQANSKSGEVRAYIDTFPDGLSGMWTYKLKGQTSGKEGVAYIWLDPPVKAPTIIVQPGTAKMTDTIAFSIVGFKPNERLRINIRSPEGPTADATGGPILTGAGGGVLDFIHPAVDIQPVQYRVPGRWFYSAVAVQQETRYATTYFNLTN